MKKALPVLIILAFIAAWWFLPSGENGRSGSVNTHLPDQIDTVVLISIDTLRADHVGCYGYKPGTTPNIDLLAKDSLFFEDAFSTIPLTLPAHSSMLTGLIPPSHGVHDNFDMRLPNEAVTLAEIMQDNGYRTYGIISSVVLNHKLGLAQGFDVYDDSLGGDTDITAWVERKGGETTEKAIKWLGENRDKKKFMFIHYYDPHFSYSPPEPFSKQFKHPYDGEIAFTDHCIGRFIDKLKSLELYEDALIVITSDHGEMLGEHDEPTHAFFVYQNAVRVPLMFKLPQDAYSVKITEPCSIIDISPTILSISGIEVPEKMEGINLLSLAQSVTDKSASVVESTLEKRALFSESLTPTKYNANSLLSVISGDWHYIQTTKPEIYNRIKDPGETKNLIAKEAKRARVMQSKLKEILDRVVMSKTDASVTLDSKTMHSLESLGYVGGSVSKDFSFDVSKANPSDVLYIHGDMVKAINLTDAGKVDKAIAICQKIIKTHPDIAETYRRLGNCYSVLKLPQKEIETLHIFLKLRPGDFQALRTLSFAYSRVGQIDESIEYAKKVLEQQPGDPEFIDFLASLYIKQGSYALAIPLCLQKLSVEPENINTLSNLFFAYDKTGDFTNAVKYCESLFALRPDDPEICSNLARVHFKAGSYNVAIKFFKQSLVLAPNDMNMLRGLTNSYEAIKDYEHAAETLEIIAGLEPQRVIVYDRLETFYRKQKLPRKVAEALKSRLELTPKHIGTKLKLVGVYTELKEYQLCVDRLKELLEVIPENVKVNFRLAENYRHLEKYPEAVQSFLRILELNPEYLKAHLGLSQSYLKMNMLKEAVAQYESVLKLKPNTILAHNKIAWLQGSQRDPELYNPESALVHAKRAAELTRDKVSDKYMNQNILDTLAVAQAANGQFAAAVETASLSIEICLEKGLTSQAEEIQKRLDLYKDQKAYRE